MNAMITPQDHLKSSLVSSRPHSQVSGQRPFVTIPENATCFDLHCHSRCSDGALEPHELITRAQSLHIDVLAITDHDSIAGYERLMNAAENSLAADVVLIPGVEISTRWEGFEIHILGWNFDPAASGLKRLLASQQEKRQQRSCAIYEKLRQQGISEHDLPNPYEQSADHVLTRLHFANALVASKYCADVQGAFSRYLGRGQCAYVASQWCSIQEAVQAIRAAGGMAGLAHPLAYGLSNKGLRRLLTELQDCGAQVLEAVSAQQAGWQREWLLSLAYEYGFYVSVGSDFHAPGKYRELGQNLKFHSQVPPVWEQWKTKGNP